MARDKWDFAGQLRRFGPDCDSSGDLRYACGYCRWVAASHGENFAAVSSLAPRHLRAPLEAVYAWCRWADDLGDEATSPAVALEQLVWWRAELGRCFAGGARHPVTVALAPVVRRFGLDAAPFHNLLDAFEQDQRVTDYATFAELLGYCVRSANPVGRIVLALYGAATPARLAWSDEICTGLQLANFWQDVARDALIGRVYLPREDRARFGPLVESGRATDAGRALIAAQVARARGYFERGEPLLSDLPRGVRAPFALFHGGGVVTLDAIRAAGHDVWAARPRATKWAKARLLGRALLSTLR